MSYWKNDYKNSEEYKEKAKKDFLKAITAKGREYRKWLKLRKDHATFLKLIPDRLHEISGIRIWQSTSGRHEVWLTMQYSDAKIKLMQEIMAEAGWSTIDEIKPQPSNYLHYNHPGVPNPFYFCVNVDTPREIQTSDGEICVIVPIEWETQLVPKTYDRLCPQGHPELFDEDGQYIGDALFPPMPKEA